VTGPVLETGRLVLRRWRGEDRAPFAQLNADPEVMACFPRLLSSEESDALAARIEEGFERDGFGLWALEVRASGSFVGFTGLSVPTFEAQFIPAVEVGWRLARSAWGQGYATEAATAALDFAFGPATLDEVVSFTTPLNRRSVSVMQRLGMSHDPADDFEHPMIPPGHRLRRHVLYRIDAARWRSGASRRRESRLPVPVQPSPAPIRPPRR
jgi:ribosomal-protein-alanine N-acetyltransferase